MASKSSGKKTTTLKPKAKRKSNAGRKTKLTPEVRKKIEEAAALDASVEEMAFYAGVSRQSIHKWLTDDPEFSDRIEDLRQKPILAARQAALRHSTDSYGTAMDYLKRKKRAEFGDRQTHVTEDEEGKVLPITGMVIQKDNADQVQDKK